MRSTSRARQCTPAPCIGRPPLPAMHRPCRTSATPTCRLHGKALHFPAPVHGVPLRPRQVLRRTSEHWWEDEQEFDAVAGEVLLPKTLYILAVDDCSQDAAAQQSRAAAQLVQALLGNNSVTAGFCSPQCKAAAEAVWDAIGAGGPPYFRKVRQRDGLGSDDTQVLFSLLAELLGQNWRVELDYGLQGGTLTPSEHILLITNRHHARAVLNELLAGSPEHNPASKHLEQEAAGSPALLQIKVRGWNTGVAAGDNQPALRNWRDDLKPTFVSVQHASS